MIALPLNDVGRARLALIDAMDRAARVESAQVSDPHSIDRWSTGESLRHASARLQEFAVRNARAFLQDALDTERHLALPVGVVELVKQFEAYLVAVRAAGACRRCSATAAASCTVGVGGRYAAGRREVAWVCPERAQDAEVVR